MAYTNLPGMFPDLIDHNLVQTAQNDDPIIVVLGTAAKGDATSVYKVDQASDAASQYGKTEGTLIRGLYEVDQGGGQNLKLVRIGAKSATLSGVGAGTGLTIETLEKDEKAGQNVKIFWDDSEVRLRIWRVSDDLLIYDNNPTYPMGAVDEHIVSVTGTATASADIDLGSLASPITLEAADGIGASTTYTAGTDGIQLSRMALFEALYEGYIMLENEDLDIVVPQNVYLDDLNVSDMTTAQLNTLNTAPPWAAASVYPTPGTAFDALGEVFVQEYEGKYYFWWDMDRDGIAEIFPTGIGLATGSLDAYGTALTSGDFHEANFAYQLANFCYENSELEVMTIGSIGVKPPNSWTPKDVSSWIGKVPTFTTDGSNNEVVSTNGSGLLGIKWVAGRIASAGLPDHTVGGIAGLSYGGFIATDTGWPDGTQQYDLNDALIDIGKYISLVGSYAIFSNSTSDNSYMATGASQYAGFVSTLNSNSAPTNKVIPGIRIPFRIKNSKLDDLAGMRYVFFAQKKKGVVVMDAPTAARPDSDYQRIMTIRIVNEVIESLRSAADPFIGEGVLNGPKAVGLDTALESALKKYVPTHIERYEKKLTYTQSQKIRGEATVKLLLVPVFELRRLYFEIALSAS